MDIMKNLKHNRIALLSLLLVLATIVISFVANYELTFEMDDNWYSTNLVTGEPIESFADVFESQVWHYNNWGGRSLTHSLLQLILWAGENVANILNVIMTLVLGCLICKVGNVKGYLWLFASLAMMIGLNANWRMSMFWQSGAVNYLYFSVFILFYLYCYIRPDIEKRMPGICFWMLPLGLVVGWSNENMGPMAWCISMIIIIYEYCHNRKFYLWMILGNIPCLIGSILMIMAPGNYVRSSRIEANEYGFIWQLFLRCYSECKAAFEFLFPVILLTAICVFICIRVLKIELGKTNICLILGALLSWGAMILSPHYPDRATFGTMILLICVIISLMNKIVEKVPECKWLVFGGSVLIWLRGVFMIAELLTSRWGWIKGI